MVLKHGYRYLTITRINNYTAVIKPNIIKGTSLRSRRVTHLEERARLMVLTDMQSGENGGAQNTRYGAQ